MRARVRRAAVLSALTLATGGQAPASDPIDRLLASGRVPPAMIVDRAHSDFTEPLGQYLDFLAAGAFARARALQPRACAEWSATRQVSGLSGKFLVWDTMLDLNEICGVR